MVEPSGVSGRAPFANWTHRHSCGGGAFGFPFFGPCNPGPNSPSLEHAELAWAPDPEAAHSCIVRGRHGPTEGLLNLFQPGKRNPRQHRHAPGACARRPASSLPGMSVLGIRLATQRRRGFYRCTLTHGTSACFGDFCCIVPILRKWPAMCLGSVPRGSRREQVWSLSGTNRQEGEHWRSVQTPS
jgi:hypothetical protein